MEIFREPGSGEIRIRGRVGNEDVDLLARELNALQPDQEEWVLLDLSGVEFLSSSPIGILVGLVDRFHLAGGNLAFLRPPPPVMHGLETMGVADFLPFHDTRGEALAALGAETP